MISNHFKITWRNLTRNKAFSFINIFGLTLGMTCSLLIFLWVRDERSIDQFHQNGSSLYGVYESIYAGGQPETGHWTPGLLAGELKRKIPEIKYASAKALTGPDAIAISRTMANNFFGGPAAAFGKTIRYNNTQDFRIAAVFDVPTTSSQKFDFALNWDFTLKTVTWLKSWVYRTPATFIRLEPGADAQKVQVKIKDFITPYLTAADGAGFHIELGLQQYGDIYLHDGFKNGKPGGGRIAYVQLFSLIAVFILLIACINFMNLATARSVKRAKEVGIRKTIGALRSRLIGQFIGEALVLTGFAVILALGLVIIVLPAFNQLTHKQIVFPFSSAGFWLVILALSGVTGVVAGSYPALYLSSLKPVKVLKSALRFSPSALLFRKGLVVFQFVLSIVLISGTIIIAQQIRYVQTVSLGFNKENLVYMPFQGDLAGKYPAFRDRLAGLPGIAAVSRSSEAPSQINAHAVDLDWTGKNPALKTQVIHNTVGYGFLQMLNIPLVQGRDFSQTHHRGGKGFSFTIVALPYSTPGPFVQRYPELGFYPG